VLIDELELALHPKAQSNSSNTQDLCSDERPNRNLFGLISQFAESVPRKDILFLDQSGARQPQYECYPAYAMGNMAYGEERGPTRYLR